MHVRFGYVAMSLEVKNASPSKTMTFTGFQKLNDRAAAIRKLERIAEDNLRNTLRLLYHNRAWDIHVYRFSSKLIPLWGHPELADWDPIPALEQHYAKIGETIKQDRVRVSFHPDHFTVLSTPRQNVLEKSMQDLRRHTRMLEAMGLGEEAKLNIHIGGTYGNKEKSLQRFIQQFQQLDKDLQQRITLENDDKTYTAAETLQVCQALDVPMVLDLHHHQINRENNQTAAELWPQILQTWQSQPKLPPKIHVSSPKNERSPRAHADTVELGPFYDFLQHIADDTERLDVMIEAKHKDKALFKLMSEITKLPQVQAIDQASVLI